MKKLFIILIVVALIIVGYSYDQFLWCKKLFLSEPTTHTIQKGEYLSKIALKYYGRADYWRELALINRAPDSDAIFPDEEIVIPSIEVIKKIRRTRWLSRVNHYMKDQEDILAGLISEQNEQLLTDAKPKTVPESYPLETKPQAELTKSNEGQLSAEVGNMEEDNPPVKSSSLYLILAIVGIVLISAAIGYFMYRKRKQDDLYSIAEEVDFNDEPDAEPDYQAYLKRKKKMNEALVN